MERKLDFEFIDYDYGTKDRSRAKELFVKAVTFGRRCFLAFFAR